MKHGECFFIHLYYLTTVLLASVRIPKLCPYRKVPRIKTYGILFMPTLIYNWAFASLKGCKQDQAVEHHALVLGLAIYPPSRRPAASRTFWCKQGTTSSGTSLGHSQCPAWSVLDSVMSVVPWCCQPMWSSSMPRGNSPDSDFQLTDHLQYTQHLFPGLGDVLDAPPND